MRTASRDVRAARLGALVAALAALVLLGAADATAAGRRIALVLGNGAYAAEERLDSPRHDAADMSAVLKQLGFDIVAGPGIDLDQKAMEQAVNKFAQAASDADVALFYYAGHGVGSGGDNWLIPVKTEITDPADLRYRAVSLRWIADRLKKSGARARILIVDACRNNRWYEAERGPGERGLTRITPPTGTLIAYAAAPGETTKDTHPSRHNGLYTGELVQALEREPELEIRELIRRVGDRVHRLDARQSPSTEEIGFYTSLHLAQPTSVVDPRAEEDTAWQQAHKLGTVPAYQGYLARYPQGRYAEWAQSRIERLGRSLPSSSAVPRAAPARTPAVSSQAALSPASAAPSTPSDVTRAIERPVPKVGDECRYDILDNLKGEEKIAESDGVVTAVDGDRITINWKVKKVVSRDTEDLEDEIWVCDKDLNVMRKNNRTFDPPWPFRFYPITPGATRKDAKSAYSRRTGGGESTLSFDGAVGEWQQTKVAAGTFDTLTISWKGYYRASTGLNSWTGLNAQEVALSPKTWCHVRMRFKDTRANGRAWADRTYTLTSFKE